MDLVLKGARIVGTRWRAPAATSGRSGTCEPFAAIVQHGQVAGVQFHPEKSGDVGLRILRNFVQLAG